MFLKGKSELFSLSEKKMKGNGEVSWCGVNGLSADVQETEALGRVRLFS